MSAKKISPLALTAPGDRLILRVRGSPANTHTGDGMTIDQRIWAIVAKMTDRGIDGLLDSDKGRHSPHRHIVLMAAARQARWARG